MDLALVLCAGAAVLGATFQAPSIERLAREADLIIVGTVQTLQSIGTAEGPSTKVVIAVGQVWKGSVGGEVIVIQEGGSQGALTYSVPGSPTFQPSEEVLLFLTRDADDRYVVLNGRSGKWLVRKDRRGDKALLQSPDGQPWPLGDVRERIHTILQGKAERK